MLLKGLTHLEAVEGNYFEGNFKKRKTKTEQIGSQKLIQFFVDKFFGRKKVFLC
jgi:hypothetical protein